MNLEKMLRSSGVVLPPKKRRQIYVSGERILSEWESEMVHYVKQESGRGSEFLRLLLFLMFVPLLTSIMFLSLLMVGFAMLGIYVKDLLAELTLLCSGLYSRVRKKLREILPK